MAKANKFIMPDGSEIAIAGAEGGGANGIPTGGTTGQVLTKNSDADYDANWVDAKTEINFTENETLGIMPYKKKESYQTTRTAYYFDYVVGNGYLYLFSTNLNVATDGNFDEIRSVDKYNYVQWKKTYTSMEKVKLWGIPEIQTSGNYPHKIYYKLNLEELDSWYISNGLAKIGDKKEIFVVVKAGWEFNFEFYQGDNWTHALMLKEAKEEDYYNNFSDKTIITETFKNALNIANAINNTYNCKNYGITPESEDNSEKLQSLINNLSENGGGIIFIPNGTYVFDTSKSAKDILTANGSKCIIKAKSNVSIIGESITGVIIKMIGNSEKGACMFGYNNSEGVPIEGCNYRNFTIDGTECTIDKYSSDGKAFFYQYVKDCIFRDLRLIGTPATSLGIDFLDNVVIDSVYCYNSGRIHEETSPGGAGIGIGTGKWENENFIIRNCICDSCGHFGIFLEDQSIFSLPPNLDSPLKSKGAIIANNICRNGRNYGFGLRGGRNIKFIGNIAYENVGGFFSDYNSNKCSVENNFFYENTEAGIKLKKENTNHPFNIIDMVFINNIISGNNNGVIIGNSTENNIWMSNIIKDNTEKSISVEAVQTGLIQSGNIISGEKNDSNGYFD